MSRFMDTIGRWGLGNIDLNNRIVVHNPDQSISTERSISVNIDGKEVLIPTVVNGEIVSDNDAIDRYITSGEYLGKFDTVAAAEDYADRLHERQQWYYEEGRGFGMRTYKFDMGIMANAVALPDPQKMSYQVGDLDTSGSRDATGLLHRAYVATKINYEMSWNGLEWEELQIILAALNTPKFSFTAPDPRTFTTRYTGDYYVGDRTGDVLYYIEDRADKATYSLKVKFIEY